MNLVEHLFAHQSASNAALVGDKHRQTASHMDARKQIEDLREELELLPALHIVINPSAIDDAITIEEDCSHSQLSVVRRQLLEVKGNVLKSSFPPTFYSAFPFLMTDL